MKSRLLALFAICILSMFIMKILIAQSSEPTAEIKLDFVSEHKVDEDPSLEDTGLASGLDNVGLGETVYLLGSGSGTNISYQWSIEGPTGSSVTLSSTDKESTYFQPDVEGIYTLTLTVTADEGTASSSIKVQAGKYLSVGEIDGLSATFPQCGLGCHQDIYDKWKQTGHGTAFIRKIDEEGGHFSSNCISCHTLGYNTLPTAVNDGFDDIAESFGWTFPDTIKSGNWQDMIDNYPSLAQRANIQCENCHGPGSGHTFKFKRGPIDVSGIGKSYEAGICAVCHDAPTHHVYYPEWESSGHAKEEVHMNSSSCAECHTGKGFVIQNIRGEASEAPYDDGIAITCQACHDPHSVDNEHQLRKVANVTLNDETTVVSEGGKGKLCMNCHISRRNAEEYVTEYHSNYGPHYSNQTDMYIGANAIEFGLSMPRTGHIKAIENSCVTCHMNEPDEAHLDSLHIAKVGRHSFRMVYTTGIDTIYNVKTCKNCHGSDVAKFDDIKAAADYDGDGTVEGAVSEIAGLMEQLGMILPPIGEPEVDVADDYTPVQLKSAYNYEFVAEDGSHGIHNTSYAVAILKAAIQAVTTGDIGAGSIIAITDVPNDQGKQVRIRWNRFPGDGKSDNPIGKYGIWRRIDDMSLTKNANTVSSYEDMFNSLEKTSEGSQFVVSESGELWDFVKEVTVTGEDKYSTIAATLFDSTIIDGMHWSVFYVSGHALEGGLVVKSAVDSGYSVDNLVPEVPVPKMASKAAGMVTIEWTEPVDEDFKYFKVYRGTAQGFDPATVEPVARRVETEFTENLSTVGEKYYYRITAVDFNGNESGFSLEISEDNVITSLELGDMSSIPTKFALEQNYPNPFNPTTHIRYQLPKSIYVTLSIYGITGNLIRTLVSEYQHAGFIEVEWDGKDDFGSPVASGIYIYRITAGKFSESRKMIFLK